MQKNSVVWTQDSCQYCDMVKGMLKNAGYTVTEKKIDGITVTKKDLFDILPSVRSVPQVFINNNHVGGYKELRAYLDDNI